MKYLDKLIQDYNFVIQSYYIEQGENHSYFISEFDFYEFMNELSDLSDIVDKFLFLKFIYTEISRELQFAQSEFKAQSSWLKIDSFTEKSKEEIRNEVDFFKSVINDLEKLLKKIDYEMDELKTISQLTKFNADIDLDKIKNKNSKFGTKQNDTIKKFRFQGTEKSLLIIIDILFNSGFLLKEDYKISNAILRDSFLNKDSQPYNNKQLSVSRMKIDKFNKINKSDDDFTKFQKLSDNLYKLIDNN